MAGDWAHMPPLPRQDLTLCIAGLREKAVCRWLEASLITRFECGGSAEQSLGYISHKLADLERHPIPAPANGTAHVTYYTNIPDVAII